MKYELFINYKGLGGGWLNKDDTEGTKCLFRLNRPPIPEHSGHLIRRKAASCSGHLGPPFIGAKRRWFFVIFQTLSYSSSLNKIFSRILPLS